MDLWLLWTPNHHHLLITNKNTARVIANEKLRKTNFVAKIINQKESQIVLKLSGNLLSYTANMHAQSFEKGPHLINHLIKLYVSSAVDYMSYITYLYVFFVLFCFLFELQKKIRHTPSVG